MDGLEGSGMARLLQRQWRAGVRRRHDSATPRAACCGPQRSTWCAENYKHVLNRLAARMQRSR